MMKKMIVIGIALALLLPVTAALAQCQSGAGMMGSGGGMMGSGGGCSMGGAGMSGSGSCPLRSGGTPAVPAANQLQVTGTVVSLAGNGLALVDTGTAKVYVAVCGTAAGGETVSLRVGDRVQVSGVLLALSVQPGGTTTPARQAQVRLQVGNILCGLCSAAVQKALQAVPGVRAVQVTAEGVAKVTYTPGATTPEALVKAVVAARHPHAGMAFTARVVN